MPLFWPLCSCEMMKFHPPAEISSDLERSLEDFVQRNILVRGTLRRCQGAERDWEGAGGLVWESRRNGVSGSEIREKWGPCVGYVGEMGLFCGISGSNGVFVCEMHEERGPCVGYPGTVHQRRTLRFSLRVFLGQKRLGSGEKGKITPAKEFLLPDLTQKVD